jgi:hypothetical protein
MTPRGAPSRIARNTANAFINGLFFMPLLSFLHLVFFQPAHTDPISLSL